MDLWYAEVPHELEGVARWWLCEVQHCVNMQYKEFEQHIDPLFGDLTVVQLQPFLSHELEGVACWWVCEVQHSVNMQHRDLEQMY